MSDKAEDNLKYGTKKYFKQSFKRYGKKKGESIFYAMENSGKLKGVKKKTSRNK